jgi:RNA polymerase sigma-70 factor (ECF subfamily)
MESASQGEATLLLAALRSGDPEAAGKLLPLIYHELHRLASAYMRRERPDHTLQPTALIHEAYLKLTGGEPVDWQNRAHFVGAAAQAMRRILIDHARHREAAIHGGGQRKLPLDDALLLSPERASELIALDQALERLGRIAPRQSRVVDLRFFGGLTVEETAEVLGVSPRAVKRDWNVARAWLHAALGPDS